MLTRIHKRFGTPGLVLGIIACIIALSGTAIAALPGLNGKQKKEVKKIAKQFAKPGPQGAQGPAGAQGAAGAAGKDGASGAPGSPGQPGEPGEAGVCSAGNSECFLPAGATVTGDWGFAQQGANLAFVAISYPLRVTGEPVLNFINEKGEAEHYGSIANCPGTAQNPLADPGNLCVYAEPGAQENLGEPDFEAFATSDDHSGKVFAFHVPNAAEQSIGIGSWALTAFCPEEEPDC